MYAANYSMNYNQCHYDEIISPCNIVRRGALKGKVLKGQSEVFSAFRTEKRDLERRNSDIELYNWATTVEVPVIHVIDYDEMVYQEALASFNMLINEKTVPLPQPEDIAPPTCCCGCPCQLNQYIVCDPTGNPEDCVTEAIWICSEGTCMDWMVFAEQSVYEEHIACMPCY